MSTRRPPGRLHRVYCCPLLPSDLLLVEAGPCARHPGKTGGQASTMPPANERNRTTLGLVARLEGLAGSRDSVVRDADCPLVARLDGHRSQIVMRQLQRTALWPDCDGQFQHVAMVDRPAMYCRCLVRLACEPAPYLGGSLMGVKALLARFVAVALCCVGAVTFNPSSAEAASAIQFGKIYYNSPGSDTGSNRA